MKSFARRVWKSLSPNKKELLKTKLPLITLNAVTISNIFKTFSNVILEIGFGMGDHLLYQAQNNPNNCFIGIEPYLNGVAKVLSEKEEEELSNIYLWADDADLILDKLPENLLNTIYILFPDPWPKKKQIKRRFISQERLALLARLLRPRGRMYFASDIESYITQVQELVANIDALSYITADSTKPEWDYQPTGYHLKALKNNRIPQFLTLVKR